MRWTRWLVPIVPSACWQPVGAIHEGLRELVTGEEQMVQSECRRDTDLPLENRGLARQQPVRAPRSRVTVELDVHSVETVP